MSKRLPLNPNLGNLKKQAKQLLKAYEAQEPQTLERVACWQSAQSKHVAQGYLTVRQAQQILAFEYGFYSWQALTVAIGPLRTIFMAKKNNDMNALSYAMKKIIRTHFRSCLPENSTTPVFSDEVKEVLQGIRQEAARFKRKSIEPEHILLGIIHYGAGTAFNALKNQGLGPQQARLIADHSLKQTEEDLISPSFTSQVKRFLENAMYLALRHGSLNVSTGHLLLALLEEKPRLVGLLQTRFGVDMQGIAAHVKRDHQEHI